MKPFIAPYLKAIVAGTLAGLSQLYIALQDGTVSAQEWVTVAIWTISAAAAIYGVPNTPTNTPTLASTVQTTLPAEIYTRPAATFPTVPTTTSIPANTTSTTVTTAEGLIHIPTFDPATGQPTNPTTPAA